MGKSKKVSLTLENAADRIHAWLQVEWPEIMTWRDPNIWLTGSKIWRQVYGLMPDSDSDLDIFVMACGPMDRPGGCIRPGDPCNLHLSLSEWFRRMEIPVKAGTKMKTSLGGERIHTDRGAVDLWTCRLPSPRDQLMNYPEESHGQARVAYCPANGELIILRNPRAQPAAKPLPITGTVEFKPFTGEIRIGGTTIVDSVVMGPSFSTKLFDLKYYGLAAMPGFIPAPSLPTAPVPIVLHESWNERCPSCGKGIYRGLVNVEHEGGECQKGQ